MYDDKEKKKFIKENRKYTQQLYNDLKCEDLSIMESQKVLYRARPLIKYFQKYNSCKTGVVYTKKKYKQDNFSLKFKVGMSRFSSTLNNPMLSPDPFEIEPDLSFTWGIEAQYFLPFPKDKTSKTAAYAGYSRILYAPSRAEQSPAFPIYYGGDCSIGIRHYLLFKDHAGLYAGAAFQYNFPLNVGISFRDGSDYLRGVSSGNVAISAGYTNRGRHSIELQWQSPRDFLPSSSAWSSTFNFISIMYGYSFL